MTINWPSSDSVDIRAGKAHYKAAIVCRRGHTLSYLNSPTELATDSALKCTICGANNLKSCPSCSTRIRGGFYSPLLLGLSEYTPENFCDSCGKAFPWASQQARIWELENVLDEQEIDESDRTQISFQLAKIVNEQLGDEDELRVWNKIKSAMGTTINNERVKSLVFDLIGSYVKTNVFM